MQRLFSLVMCFMCLFSFTACGVTPAAEPGVYIIHILFAFSEEVTNELGMESPMEAYVAEANNLTTNKGGTEMPILGENSFYTQLSTALNGKTGNEAIVIFENFVDDYSDEPSELYNPEGYFIPLEGETQYVQPFTDVARELYQSNPTKGNAFINGELAYCVTYYGVHFAMIRNVA